MGLKDELVVVSDPTEEEEEEADLVDPHDTLREECKPGCAKYQDVLDACTERVENTEGTEETCTQELFDFLHCVDHCASKSLFSKLK